MASTCLFIGALVQFGVGFAFPRYHTEWREQPSRTVQRGAGQEKPLRRNLGETRAESVRSLRQMLCVITSSVIGSVLGGCRWGLFSSGAHVVSWQGKSNTYESSTFEVPGTGRELEMRREAQAGAAAGPQSAEGGAHGSMNHTARRSVVRMLG